MKKFFQPVLYGCIAITSYIHPAHAQDLAMADNSFEKVPSYLHAIANGHAAATARRAARVNTKVTRIFLKFYKNAENVRWFHNGKGYLAMFDWAGVPSHASYGKDGYWYYDVRFGTEKDLPAAARKLLKSHYVDYTIGRATEVNVGNQKAWVVNLEDADNLVLVRIIDGHMDELAHYNTH